MSSVQGNVNSGNENPLKITFWNKGDANGIRYVVVFMGSNTSLNSTNQTLNTHSLTKA